MSFVGLKQIELVVSAVQNFYIVMRILSVWQILGNQYIKK